MKDFRAFEKHFDAIKTITEGYKTNRILFGFPSALITMLEGCQKLDQTASEYLTTCHTFMKVLDDITDLLGHVEESMRREDFERLKHHYSELQLLFCNHYGNTSGRVCPKSNQC